MSAERRYRLWMVDDDADLANIQKIRLESSGFHVTWFPSGADCLKSHEEVPDLILLDLDMPEKNGLATFIELKRLLKHRSGERGTLYPVILTTGVKSPSVQDLFRTEGVFDYLVKPVASEKLLETVRKAVAYFHGAAVNPSSVPGKQA